MKAVLTSHDSCMFMPHAALAPPHRLLYSLYVYMPLTMAGTAGSGCYGEVAAVLGCAHHTHALQRTAAITGHSVYLIHYLTPYRTPAPSQLRLPGTC
jgi:hypothetical protein